MRRFIILVSTSLGLVASPVLAEPTVDSSDIDICEGCEALLELAIANPRRAADRARDQFRHPAETLAFFKVRPGMTVVDYMPGGGWYTRLLVPYLGKDGHYIGLNPDPGCNQQLAGYLGGLHEKLPAAAEAWNLEGATLDAYNSNELTDDMNGTVDRVLIMREMHNLHRNGLLHGEFETIYRLLKPGGMVGIVEHRAKPDAPAEYVDGNHGYMRQKDVIGLVEAQGFELVAASEINANAKDPANHEKGVWELPPVWRTKREELRSIGESDRMTLLFRKRP